jgi:ribosomal protein L19E
MSIEKIISKLTTWIELINRMVTKNDIQSLIKFGVIVIFLKYAVTAQINR